MTSLFRYLFSSSSSSSSTSKNTKTTEGNDEGNEEKEQQSTLLPSERFIGLDNYGNTCYCNSVLQVLFACKEFRHNLISTNHSLLLPQEEEQQQKDAKKNSGTENTTNKVSVQPTSSSTSSLASSILSSIFSSSSTSSINNNNPNNKIKNNISVVEELRNLFAEISKHKQSQGKSTLGIQKFLSAVKKDNEIFRNWNQQDAHEFYNYLINVLDEAYKRADINPAREAFQGKVVNSTECLKCNKTSTREEDFFDLSLDITLSESVADALNKFTEKELMTKDDRFFCDNCKSLEDANRWLEIKEYPSVLVLHLKRFKYIENLGRYLKLSYDFSFPFQLEVAENQYSLLGIVVHIGSGPNIGHYIAFVRSENQTEKEPLPNENNESVPKKDDSTWIVYDDDSVQSVKSSYIPRLFGGKINNKSTSSIETGYILFYSLNNKKL